MATRYREETFPVPANRLWQTLVDWGGIADWFPEGYIESLDLVGAGDGAVRIITAPTGQRLGERLDGADHEHFIIQLSITDPMPEGLVYYRATGQIFPLDAASCRLTWASAFKAVDPATEQQFNEWFGMAVKDMFVGLRDRFSSPHQG